MTEQRRFRILSLDGGGLRGVYAASALARLERMSERPIFQSFDLVVGTSTGGIIGLGIALGLSADSIRDFYLRDGPQIFPKRTGGNFRMAFGPKHSNAELRRVLQAKFGKKLLGHAKTRLCVTTVNATTGSPRVFKTAHHPDIKIDYLLPAWRVAMATSAAPFYLAGVKVDGGPDAFVDGGLWANNPAMMGLVEALSFLNAKLDDISILSLGAGQPPGVMKDKVLRPKLLTWVPDIMHVTIGSQTKAVDFQMKIFARASGLEYHSLSPNLNGKSPLDEPSILEPLSSAGDEAARHAYPSLHSHFFYEPTNPFEPDHEVP